MCPLQQFFQCKVIKKYIFLKVSVTSISPEETCIEVRSETHVSDRCRYESHTVSLCQVTTSVGCVHVYIMITETPHCLAPSIFLFCHVVVCEGLLDHSPSLLTTHLSHLLSNLTFTNGLQAHFECALWFWQMTYRGICRREMKKKKATN